MSGLGALSRSSPALVSSPGRETGWQGAGLGSQGQTCISVLMVSVSGARPALPIARKVGPATCSIEQFSAQARVAAAV